MDRNISIIITTTDKDSILRDSLPQILSQEYDAEYEVIVVRETRIGMVKDILEPLKINHPNLKTTFLSDKPQYVSDDDIEVLLAVKASKYENIILIPPSVIPDSEKWLQNLANSLFSTEDTCGLATPSAVLFGDAHYRKQLGLLKRFRHKKKVQKVLKEWCDENAISKKTLFAPSPEKHSFSIAFHHSEYIENFLLRKIISNHIRIF